MENRQTNFIKPALSQTAKLAEPPQANLDSPFAGLEHGNSPVPNARNVKRFTTSVEDAFKCVDAAVFADTKKHLTDVQMFVFWGSWQGQKYDQIAEAYGYSHKYIKQDIGPKLWKLLSKALGEKVSKKNFQAAVERQWQSQLEAVERISNTTLSVRTADSYAVHGSD